MLGLVVWDVPDAEAAEIHAALQAGPGNGTLRPVIASELPLASAPEAHLRIMESGARGKIVLIPWRSNASAHWRVPVILGTRVDQ